MRHRNSSSNYSSRQGTSRGTNQHLPTKNQDKAKKQHQPTKKKTKKGFGINKTSKLLNSYDPFDDQPILLLVNLLNQDTQ